MTLEISIASFVGYILLLIGGFLLGQLVKHRGTKEKFFLYYGVGIGIATTSLGAILVLVDTGVIKFV